MKTQQPTQQTANGLDTLKHVADENEFIDLFVSLTKDDENICY